MEMSDLHRIRMKLKRLVQRAEKTPANEALSREVSEKIYELCEQTEDMPEDEALDLLWLVADELFPHYEIIEATASVYESLETWASVVADIIDKINLSPAQRQRLQQQIQSWDVLDDMGLRDPLQELIDSLNDES